ncbi:MAG: 5'-nucleotidase C-terminal domain-containing protein [Oligoflexus sp.]|jgi:2',3'-cyclic-nucleotide 2'-phosphodiesterase (5'-nucleotidase family)|nr:5'-nucleotidase C-terminal domain-containing protein [Pseudopedobacter sp.]
MQKIKLVTIIAMLAFLAACSPKLQLGKTEKQLYPISAEMPKDAAMLAFYQPYKLKLDSIMNDVVAVSTKEISKKLPEGTLNNFFADAMYYSAKAKGIEFDVAYTNSGGLRISLPEGNIYRYKIFELMPFENAFTTVKFKGQDMQRFFDYIAESGGDPISGARFTIDNKKAVDITIDGKPFDVKKEYVVLTSDYMANGGDGGQIFSKNIERKDLDYKLRDAILDYLAKLKKEGKKLNPVTDGRIKIK